MSGSHAAEYGAIFENQLAECELSDDRFDNALILELGDDPASTVPLALALIQHQTRPPWLTQLKHRLAFDLACAEQGMPPTPQGTA